MAVEVVAQIVVLGITVGRNPNCSAVDPPLRKAAGTLCASGREYGRESREELKICDNEGKTCEAVRTGFLNGSLL